MKDIKLIIFDLDGVLIDSKNNMRLSWGLVKKKYRISQSFNSYFNLIGLKFENILEKLKINNKKNVEHDYFKFTKKFQNKITLYPSIKKVINNLEKKYELAILTSKKKNRTVEILKKFDLKFKYINCPVKNKKGKPNPWQIFKLIKKLKIKKSNVVFVGDTIIDFETAKNAKIKFLYCNYGYGNFKFKKNCLNKFSDIETFLK